MKPNLRRILGLCLSEGISYGFTRAHKHTDTPDRSVIETSIYDAVMLQIDEFFDFEETEK